MLTQHDRVAVLGALRRIEAELGQIAPWLDDNEHERAAVLVEDAWRDLLAAQALIDRDPEQIRRIVTHGQALSSSGQDRM